MYKTAGRSLEGISSGSKVLFIPAKPQAGQQHEAPTTQEDLQQLGAGELPERGHQPGCRASGSSPAEVPTKSQPANQAGLKIARRGQALLDAQIGSKLLLFCLCGCWPGHRHKICDNRLGCEQGTAGADGE